MKHWSGLVYLVAGVIIGLLVGASLTGIAAGGDEPARADNHPGRYTFAYSEGSEWAVLDTQTGAVYRLFPNGYRNGGYDGKTMNPVEGWWEGFAVKKRVAPQPPAE